MGCEQSDNCGQESCSGCGSNEDGKLNFKKILVMSGKGGVGKSSIAANLAYWLGSLGKSAGLLDIDIHGPSVPRLLNSTKAMLRKEGDSLVPFSYSDYLKVMSIGFMLENEGQPVIWRGPAKHGMIEQFTKQVKWEGIEYLIVDCPPGTGDEALSIAQSLGGVDGVLIVTLPEGLSQADVKKCINFCRQLDLPILGILENMAGFRCPSCGEVHNVFNEGGAKLLADEFGVELLGSLPLAMEVTQALASNRLFLESSEKGETAERMKEIFSKVLDGVNQKEHKI